MKWVKISREVLASGTTTILYRLEGTGYTVMSFKRPIPHADGRGTWNHTSFFVALDGKALAEKHTLKDAKAYAEALHSQAERKKRS